MGGIGPAGGVVPTRLRHRDRGSSNRADAATALRPVRWSAVIEHFDLGWVAPCRHRRTGCDVPGRSLGERDGRRTRRNRRALTVDVQLTRAQRSRHARYPRASCAGRRLPAANSDSAAHDGLRARRRLVDHVVTVAAGISGGETQGCGQRVGAVGEHDVQVGVHVRQLTADRSLRCSDAVEGSRPGTALRTAAAGRDVDRRSRSFGRGRRGRHHADHRKSDRAGNQNE